MTLISDFDGEKTYFVYAAYDEVGNGWRYYVGYVNRGLSRSSNRLFNDSLENTVPTENYSSLLHEPSDPYEDVEWFGTQVSYNNDIHVTFEPYKIDGVVRRSHSDQKLYEVLKYETRTLAYIHEAGEDLYVSNSQYAAFLEKTSSMKTTLDNR